ncbi:BPSS1780 family membrane protein [Hydrogenophaga flava]|uniref:BPSS1780 family membrane protein n=1 Tax=Hydrogenophaga flava TaxID=65657 RepID=UPI000825CF49|nr:BPSS1780 family membrane protein [Hydrogenophaga flava]
MKLRTVPASTGLQWVRLGVKTFLRQPPAMSGLFFMFMAVVSVLALVPFLGTALATLLTPAVNLGLMSASREAEAGRFPMPKQLVTALRGGPAKTRGMLTLGGLYGLGLLVILLLVGLMEGNPEGAATMTAEEAMRSMVTSPALWFGLAAMMPLQMLFWHAPALLFWHDVPPVKSLFFSLMASWANKGALLVFLLGWTGLFVAFSVSLSLLSALLGGADAAGLIVYPAVLFMASMFFTSIWFTFRDSFDAEETPVEV